MIVILAWRNIWRNKKRSAVILAAIAFGLTGGLFAGAVMMGMGESMINSAIDRNLAHIQIHTNAFKDDMLIRNNLKDASRIEEKVEHLPGVKAVSARTVFEAMAASPSSSYGVHVMGVDRIPEMKTTRIAEKLVQGKFLEGKYRTQAVIGKKLAERLNLKLKSKIILTYQQRNGDLIYLSARVVGIFKTVSSMFDGMTVFLRQKDIARSLGLAEAPVHEIAIRCINGDVVDRLQKQISAAFPALKVESWVSLDPSLAYMSTTVEIFTYFFVALILFALLFGITNDMLMSVVERVRELGILMAVGLRKSRLFAMILLETIFLSLTGGLLGMLIGGGLIDFFYRNGFNLSIVAKSLESFGSSSVLHPFLPASMYVGMTLMIVVAANIAALLPAWKAMHLRPAEAIRTY